MSSKKRTRSSVPYIITAPFYLHTSAGVRALYILADELRARGLDATVFEYMREVAPRISRAIVVYSEVVTGNPMQAEMVVRWTMNEPGLLGGETTYAPEEYVWTWRPDFFPGAPRLTVQTIDSKLFYADATPKTLDVAYYGKGAYRGVQRTSLTRFMPEITRDPIAWPATRDELGALLRSTRTLYTYDDCTALIDEALLCGCQVVLLPEYRELGWEDAGYTDDAVHAKRIDGFAEATQARWCGARKRLAHAL